MERLLRRAAGVSPWQEGRRPARRACRADRDREIREALFPDDLAQPPGCSIKGKFAVRARVTGNVGIYQLQGCRSYPA